MFRFPVGQRWRLFLALCGVTDWRPCLSRAEEQVPSGHGSGFGDSNEAELCTELPGQTGSPVWLFTYTALLAGLFAPVPLRQVGEIGSLAPRCSDSIFWSGRAGGSI